MAELVLKPGREKPLLRRHPWIFSGAVAHLRGAAKKGQTVRVLDARGNPLALAAYSPKSQITARVWTWNQDEVVDRAFLAARLQAAVNRRGMWIDPAHSNAYRLVHGESDGVPGFIADRYGDFLVVQFLSCGAELWRMTLVDLLAELVPARGIYERSDVEVRRLEGLPQRQGVLWGTAPPEHITIIENGLQFLVDVRHGHKTGFYLDQRPNRQRVRELAGGLEVLNGFGYTGGFAVYALAGGASKVETVDSAPRALGLGNTQLALNELPAERATWVEADMFYQLRRYRDQGRRFDLIVLDPPKFAPTSAQAQRAARGYKDINLLAFKLLRPGGVLVTFSCSGGISPMLFQRIVAGAALDAGVEARIMERLSQGPDHPVALNFPEGAYLKGLICQIG